MSNWKTKLSEIAPTLAKMIGVANPAAGAVAGAVVRILTGKDSASDDELSQAVDKLTPAQFAKLQELEIGFRKTLLEAASEQQERHLRDVDSARQAYTAEMDHDNRTKWDSFVDGINRLIRPAVTVYLGLVIGGIVPVPQNLPDPVWNLSMITLTFWFGGRLLVKDGLRDVITELAKRKLAKQSNGPSIYGWQPVKKGGRDDWSYGSGREN